MITACVLMMLILKDKVDLDRHAETLCIAAVIGLMELGGELSFLAAVFGHH
jgi:hypothetical protein